jgi:hypothetical protein
VLVEVVGLALPYSRCPDKHQIYCKSKQKGEHAMMA